MIEVGEYVRTSEGHIFYIDDKRKIDALKFLSVQYGEIKTHSKNIIDLIEVGDYVNGYQLRGKTNNKVVVNYYMYSEQLAEGFWLTFYEDEIKDIVTHEQFEATKYKVEGD